MPETFRSAADFSRQSRRTVSHQAAPRQAGKRSGQQGDEQDGSHGAHYADADRSLLFAGGVMGGTGERGVLASSGPGSNLG